VPFVRYHGRPGLTGTSAEPIGPAEGVATHAEA
jgi:hypothetical protein